MTTNIINNVNNTFNLIAARNNIKEMEASTSFMTIPDGIVNEAVIKGDLRLIAKRQNDNRYFECKHANNMVLVEVAPEKYVIIDHIIESKNYRYINIPAQLKDFSWHSAKVNSKKVRCFAQAPVNPIMQEAVGVKCTYMQRIITMFKEYGELTHLKRGWQVHHKGACYDNRVGCMMYIPTKKHKHRNNHQAGRRIVSYDDLVNWINTVDKIYPWLESITDVF